MQKTKRSSIVLAVLGALGLLVGGPTASFASYHPQFHHSGSMCVSTGGSRGYYNQGIISNLSYSSSMNLFCPMVRENDNTQVGTVSVHLRDANHGEGIQCSFYDVEAYGRSWAWSGWKTSLGGGASNIGTLSWDINSVRDQYAGYNHIRCTLPPRTSDGTSYIASYRAGE